MCIILDINEPVWTPQFEGNNGGDHISEKLFVIIMIKSIKIPVYFIRNEFGKNVEKKWK